jgi:dipeptidyl aminopeptidase/acylaminoacyl peptidase
MTRIHPIAALVTPLLLAVPAWSQVERIERGNLVIEEIPAIPPTLTERLRQYQNTRSAGVSDWDPAGTGVFIVTRFGETSQIHFLERAGGARRQITFFEEPVAGAALCPDPGTRGFLFAKDVGGSEQYQGFFFDLASGSSRMITDGESRHGRGMWNTSGDAFAFSSNRRNGRDTDFYIADLDGPTYDRPVVTERGTWGAADFSPDDRSLLVMRYVSANESYYHVVDLETGERTPINPTDEQISYGDAKWSKDGRGVFMTSDEGSEFSHLRYHDLETGRFANLTPDLPWDVEDLELTRDGGTLAFVTNEGGIDRLYLMDTATRRYEAVTGLPVGQIGGLRFHPDGRWLAMSINTPRTPGDVYAYDVVDGTLSRWTHSEVGGLDTDRFVVPRLVEYPTFDQVDGKPRMIPAFYYRPTGVDGPSPVLILIHGGPEGQIVPRFSSTVQYLVNEMNIAVITPNVRGSAGYGKSYLKLDNGMRREDSVRDIGALLDWIATRPELDASRVGVYGGSYGGYMVLASMTHYNDRLKCGIDVVGISNFVTFLKNTREYRRDLRRTKYGDERDPDMRAFLEKIAPTANAYKITKPMLIVQGLNDPRVPVIESEQILEAIRGNGGTAWYLLARDEGHGFRKKSNRDYYMSAMMLFLEQHLVN